MNKNNLQLWHFQLTQKSYLLAVMWGGGEEEREREKYAHVYGHSMKVYAKGQHTSIFLSHSPFCFYEVVSTGPQESACIHFPSTVFAECTTVLGFLHKYHRTKCRQALSLTHR